MAHSLFQLLQSLFDNTSWCSYIQSHESFSARTEHLSIIQCQMRLVDE